MPRTGHPCSLSIAKPPYPRLLGAGSFTRQGIESARNKAVSADAGGILVFSVFNGAQPPVAAELCVRFVVALPYTAQKEKTNGPCPVLPHIRWACSCPGIGVCYRSTQYRATIAKEPAYKSKPKYCLLVFGPEAKTRIWLVLDGKTLYVDKNGNGDLTEAGKALVSKDSSLSFDIDAIIDRRPSIKHTSLYIAVTPEHWFVQINVEDRYQQYAYVEKLGRTPQDAPVVHLGRPLKMYLWPKARTLVRGDKPSELEVAVVTDYPGVVWAAVRDGKGVPKDIHPIAEVVFAAKGSSEKKITVKVPLKHRC